MNTKYTKSRDTLFKVVYLDDDKKEQLTFVKCFHHLLDYMKFFEVVSIDQICEPSQLSIFDLDKHNGYRIDFGTLVNVFYSGVTVVYARPLFLMQEYEKRGANMDLLRLTVTDCSSSFYKLLPLCKEAQLELDRVNAIW